MAALAQSNRTAGVWQKRNKLYNDGCDERKENRPENSK
jgi:hypothetical protein